MKSDFVIEPFDWKKQDDFCEDCGRPIGKWAVKHSHKCQGCNLRARMKRLKVQEARVSA